MLDHIHFDVNAGKIWFGGQRMMLNHASALWRLRQDLSKGLGEETTQRLFSHYGYYAGIEDAEIAKKLRPNGSWKEVFLAGPQLHTIRGMVKVVPVELKADFDTGDFFASIDWYNSFEVAYLSSQYLSYFYSAITRQRPRYLFIGKIFLTKVCGYVQQNY